MEVNGLTGTPQSISVVRCRVYAVSAWFQSGMSDTTGLGVLFPPISSWELFLSKHFRFSFHSSWFISSLFTFFISFLLSETEEPLSFYSLVRREGVPVVFVSRLVGYF